MFNYTETINKIMLSGDIGVSSATMLYYLTGNIYYGSSLDGPYDNSDFGRCLRMVEKIPDIKKHFNRIRRHNKRWENVIDNRDIMEKLYKKQEIGEIDGKELYKMLQIG